MGALSDDLCDRGDYVWQKSEITIPQLSFLLILSDSNPVYRIMVDIIIKLRSWLIIKINKLEIENNWCE